MQCFIYYIITNEIPNHFTFIFFTMKAISTPRALLRMKAKDEELWGTLEQDCL